MSAPKKLPYIKMCGFVDPGEARAAALLGADLIGLNFYSASPRAVSFALAARIQAVVHKAGAERGGKRPVRTVAVLVNPDVELVLEVLREVDPDILQFHGDEAPHVCRYFRRPFIKAFRPRGAGDLAKIPDYLGGYCVGFLIDSASGGETGNEVGGTGKPVSPTLAAEAFSKHPRGFLAGGLTPKNVGQLVRQLRPYGVDVASGIETRPGRKSPELMADFVKQVREAIYPPEE
ncbi:MAG: phosphoribosylanthranilate isomerase [Deltaproteobacteria bacterium]|nr:phosphoribosylanthranilate isomerase [Deltaproteobacteria bacterium]